MGRGYMVKKDPSVATREALGCFLILILGAFMTLGLLLVIAKGITALVHGDLNGWWRLVLLWVVAPALGIVLVAWLTTGFSSFPGPWKRR
jgi:hypothetical protein